MELSTPIAGIGLECLFLGFSIDQIPAANTGGRNNAFRQGLCSVTLILKFDTLAAVATSLLCAVMVSALSIAWSL